MSDFNQTLLQEIIALRQDVQYQNRELHTLREEIRSLRPENDRFVTPSFVARKIGTTPRTVRAWCETGKIKATQPAGDKGRWSIPYKEFVRIQHEAELNKFNTDNNLV